MASWHHDPFSEVDRSHKARKAKVHNRGRKTGQFHHMKFRTDYGTKSNPAAKDRIPVPRG